MGNNMLNDLISRKAAVNALWKALYEYENKTEKQFLESEDLDIYDWMVHRIFVQNMSDIDRRTILDLPSAERLEVQSSGCEYWDSESNFCSLYRPSAKSEIPFEIQDILDYLDAVLHPIISPEHWNVYSELYDMISTLPSAETERKTGHWIEIASSNHTYKCSVCGRLLVNITDGKNNVAKNYPYCHCGADMRGEANE